LRIVPSAARRMLHYRAMIRRLLVVLLASTAFACAGVTATQQAAKPSPWNAVPPADLRIMAERFTGEGFQQMQHQQVVLYGNGLAFWNDRLQFQVPDADVKKILAAFDANQFATARSSREGERLRRRASIRAGDYQKEVFETWEETLEEDERKEKGEREEREREEREPSLEKLTEEIFAIIVPLTTTGGVRADSFNDALAKIKSGELAAEALSLSFMVKPEVGRPSAEQTDGFLLRIEDNFATTSRFENGMFPSPVRVRLEDGAVREIASMLLDAGFNDLPVNLYAPDYEDLTVTAMQFRKNVLARQFANMTPQRFPEAQTHFAAIAKSLGERARALMRE
jgi:hypothetical protein